MNSFRFRPMLMQIVIVFLICCSVDGKKSGTRGAKKVREGKPVRSFPVTVKTSAVKLRCGKRDVIYFLDISSYNVTKKKNVDDDDDDGDTTTDCSGLQPGVITESMDCYWDRKCTVYFSNVQPIVKTCCLECVGHHPNTLHVRYMCVRKEKVSFLGANSDKIVSSDSGLLVSHTNYPWHYQPDIWVKVTLKPRSKAKRKLYLMVQQMEIDVYDRVLVRDARGNPVEVNNTRSSNISVVVGPSVSVQFNTNSDTSGARGFVFCYHWVKSSEVTPKKDVCQLVKDGSRRRHSRRIGNERKRGRKEGKRRTKRMNGKRDRHISAI